MTNTARKARKRAGEKFTRVPKVGTPLSERSIRMAHDQNGQTFGPTYTHESKRHKKQIERAQELLASE